MRCVECWTDHRLVRSELKLKLRSKFQRKALTVMKLDVAKLQSEETCNSLISLTTNGLDPLNEENIWKYFKEKIYNTTNEES